MHPDVRCVGALVLLGQRVGEIGVDEQVPAFVTDEEAALAEPPEVGAGGGRLDHSSSRTIRTPATRFASFRFAAQRAVWLSPQSVEKASRSGGAKLGEPAHARGHILRRLDVVALHVDHADGDVLRRCNRADELGLGGLAARHLEVDLVDVDAEEGGEERRVLPGRDGATLVVAEAEVGREPRPSGDRGDRAVEEVDEPLRIFSVRVAAHRGFVDRDLRAARIRKRRQLGLDDREQSLGSLPALAVKAPGERVRPRHRHLQRRPWRSDAPQALELLDRAEAARRGEIADDPVLRALVVRGRSEPARRLALLDPVDEAVEAEVEVEPGLLAVGDRVEPGGDLVVHGRDDGVLLQLGDVVGPEFAEVRGGMLEPAGQRVAADHGRAERGHCRILAPWLKPPESGSTRWSTATSRRRSTTRSCGRSSTSAIVREGVELAVRYDVASATVRPADVALAAELVAGSEVLVSTVVGFPHGSHTTRDKGGRDRGADRLPAPTRSTWC